MEFHWYLGSTIKGAVFERVDCAFQINAYCLWLEYRGHEMAGHELESSNFI